MVALVLAHEKAQSPPDLKTLRAAERAVSKVSLLPDSITTAEDVAKVRICELGRQPSLTSIQIQGLNRNLRARMTAHVKGEDTRTFPLLILVAEFVGI